MEPAPLKIIPYTADLAPVFKEINIAWLTKYFEVEPMDEFMLNNPQANIIDKGGCIFFASIAKEIVGTFALLKVEEEIFELSKMGVFENYQGKKVGNAILEASLLEAKKLNAEKLILYSNTKLQPAIHLHKKYGFVEVPIIKADYKRANIKMERVIK